MVRIGVSAAVLAASARAWAEADQPDVAGPITVCEILEVPMSVRLGPRRTLTIEALAIGVGYVAPDSTRLDGAGRTVT